MNANRRSALCVVVCGLVLAVTMLLPGCGGEDEGTGDAPAARGSDLGGGASAQPATGPATAPGNQFDPHNIDNALQWWITRVRELGAAQQSGNQIRVDAARQELDAHLASLRGQRIRYTFNVRTPSVGNAIAIGDAISREGVHIGIQHETERGAIRVGARADAAGRSHTDSTPILVRAGQGIDESTLAQLSTRSTFLAAATVTDVTWLGSTFMRPPTLVLFVDNVQIEQVNP